jgi:dimethylhistidine N-methyltransferase
MACPEYYLTRCEMEIFTKQTKEIATSFIERFKEFDVVELGAGDATKSVHLLSELVSANINFTYYPVDISKNVIKLLHQQLPQKLPALQMQGLNGEYFNMLEKAKTLSKKNKVVLFLGGNIGNVPLDKVEAFCKELQSHLSTGDIVLTGFDLKKDPQLILDAYNDKGGLTANFNLNLLQRLNDELDANFNVGNFKHYPTYDPSTGTCKSYLISKVKQEVRIGNTAISFAEGETIHTEISQKYTVKQISNLATTCGFVPINNFFDAKKWFVDAVWQV